MIAAATARFDPDVEAAMLAHYGVDVLDPAVTIRRVHVLLRRLPARAWPHGPDSPGAWPIEAHLLAALFDAVQQLTWLTSRLHGGKAPRPEPLRRPGEHKPKAEERPVSWARSLADALGVRGVAP